MAVIDIARKRRLKKRLKGWGASAVRPLALESDKTKRVRRKLLVQWEEEKIHITPKAIAETIAKMHKWIADNAKDRVPVKDKIGLFNGNKDAAALSRKIQKSVEKLRKDMESAFGATPERTLV